MDGATKMLAAVLSLIVILSLMASANCSETVFYVYGSLACPSCEEFSTGLKREFGEGSLIFMEIDRDPKVLEQMISIYEAAFPDLEKSELIIPLTVAVVDGEVRAVISGEAPMSLVKDILRSSQNLTLVYPNGRIIRESNPELSERILELMFKEPVEGRGRMSLSQVMLPILAAAAADSINPCTFSVFTALLLMTMFFKGRGKMVKTGAAFILAVYVSYYLLGLGLVKVFAAFTWLKNIIAIAGIAFGSYEIFTSLRKGFKSPIPRPLYKLTSSLVEQVSARSTVPLAFGVGIIVSFTLLPCSAGPYLVALSLIAGLSSLEKYLALAIYNTVFVIPLIVILSLVGIAAQLSRRLKMLRSKRVDILSIISSLLLIAICIWVLFQ